MIYAVAVFAPLLGSLVSGLLGRSIGDRAAMAVSILCMLLAAALGPIACYQLDRRRCRSGHRVARHLGRGRPFPRSLGAALRPAGRGDGRDGDLRRHADPRLFDRLHGARCLPALSLLRLPVAVHLLHADAGDGRQPAAALLRLGRRRSLLLSADRLLVRSPRRQRRRDQGVHRQPHRRPGLCRRRRAGVPEIRLDRIRHHLSRHRAAPGRHLLGPRRHVPGLRGDRRAAVHRRDGQVRADRPACLAARRDGRPDAGLRVDPRRDHGHRRRVPGRAHVAAV